MPETQPDPESPDATIDPAPETRSHPEDQDAPVDGDTDSVTPDRDRDETGRARQARPRDALGRPLPYGAVGVEPVSEEPLPARETVEVATGLLREGRPFSAHEVFEARWKDGPEEERDLWQGLAQLCVGLTHALRGNAVGARRLLERGTGRLERYAATGGPTYGVDLDAFSQDVRHQVEAAAAQDRSTGTHPGTTPGTHPGTTPGTHP